MAIDPKVSGKRAAVRVLVATPLGQGGRGGIDRLMDAIRLPLAEARPDNVEVRFMTTRGPGPLALSPFFLGRAVARLVLDRPDVLHVNLSSHGSATRKMLLCRAARFLNIPYVIHLHGSRFRPYFLDANAARRSRIADLFSGAARILVLGRVWRAFLGTHLPAVAGRIEILPNASRAPKSPPGRRAGPATILFLGQVGSRKGVPQLIDAFDRLRDLPGWRGIIAGNGRIGETRADIARRGLLDRVTLTGWLTPDAVEALLSTADILVLPSFDENLPMALVEGMAHGLAVVATPVGAVEDIVRDEDTGLLVPPGDAARLAKALRRLIGDPGLRCHLGDGALAFHRAHLDVEPYLTRLIGIWHDAATSRATG